ncbi:MAG: hypothetical protein NTY48_02715 [Candidatus Diapherotrites archaeon]|nr:hypothetical protein [Candidatus Diapherotrites archaeon]
MEERIINYKNNNEIKSIIDELTSQDYLFVKHSTDKKQLYFKKYPTQPETSIISEP